MTMEQAQESWKALGSRVEALGLKLKLHFEQGEGEAGEAATTLKENLEKVGDALEHVFEGLGAAASDDAIKEDAKEAGRLLLEAVNTTFTEASDELRDRIRHR
jgi:ElaB/YqjD/DUF883 family membrane-anchored ribosome-binding protein